MILAGGKASRMGGIDKPLVEYAGRGLIDHVISRVRAQVGHIVISCNRNFDAYYRRGCALIVDAEHDQGPIAGILAARSMIRTTRVLIVPGDTPLLPTDLVARLAEPASPIAVARTPRGRENLFCLADSSELDSLARFYRAGGRAMHRWLDEQPGLAEVLMPSLGFSNINTVEDLARLPASPTSS